MDKEHIISVIAYLIAIALMIIGFKAGQYAPLFLLGAVLVIAVKWYYVAVKWGHDE